MKIQVVDNILVYSPPVNEATKKRGLITPNANEYLYGLVGDGGEMTITVAKNGDLLCVTRNDLSTDHPATNTTCGARLFVSDDNGYT